MEHKYYSIWHNTGKAISFFLLYLSGNIVFAEVPRQFFELESPCNPVYSTTCALPYPSDVFAIENASSKTGLSLVFPDGIVRQELLDEVPETLTPQTVFNGSSGYSAATSVLFELQSKPDLASLPEGGGESVVAYDLDTGERIPLRVQFNDYANSNKVSSPSPIVEIYPRARWQFSHRYVVFVTHQLRDQSGKPYEPSAGFGQAISNDGSPIARYYDPVIDFVEQRGYPKEQLTSLTFFSVRDEDEVTLPIRTLAKTIYSKEHPLRDLKVYYKPFGRIAAIVTGDILVHNYRDQYGGALYDPSAATENWIRFRLTLPSAAKRSKVPISIYGHGLTVNKQSDLVVSVINAIMGIATIAIDHPNHGSRSEADGGYVLSNLDTQYVPMQAGMVVQSTLDHIALLKAVQTSVAELDVLPKRFLGGFISRPERNGNGIPEIDPSRVFYQGTSLGGVLGSTFVALAPELEGAFLHVTGVGITNILSNSVVWDSMFSKLEPEEANGAEAMVLKAAMQHEMDYGDAINFAHYFRNPPAGILPKPVAVMAGLNDGIVPNFSTVALAEIAQLPLIGTERFPIPGVGQAENFVDGNGVKQFPALIPTGTNLDKLLAHGSFIRLDAMAYMIKWIRGTVLD